MRLGFLAKVWLVLVVLCAAASTAVAAEPATPSAEEAACERVEVAEALVSSALDLTAGPPAPRPLPLLPDALLCARGGMAVDCELHDPASRPRAPSPSASAAPDVVSDTVAEPPAPDATRLAAGIRTLGSACPGFARGLYRPPRV
jgi:hypothetical protein